MFISIDLPASQIEQRGRKYPEWYCQTHALIHCFLREST